jgi:hypothetical protein
MHAPSTELLQEALAETLQTTAFLCPEPAPADTPAPADVVQVSLSWSGSPGSEMQLAAPRQLGELLAATILALEPGSPQAAPRALDALKELCNITAGALLSRLCEGSQEVPEMTLPRAASLPDAAAWSRFIAGPGTLVLLAEGHPVALRVQESQA